MKAAAQEKASGHSADVRLHLTIDGQVLPIAQLGPTFLILRLPAEHPPGEAEIFMSIDGHETRWRVYLPDGIAPTKLETPIARSGPSFNGSTV